MIATEKFPAHLTGLTDPQVEAARKEYGLNIQYVGSKYTWWIILFNILKEPMLILLFIVTGIYFMIGDTGEAYFMLGAIVIVSGISFYQDNRSRIALESIKALTAPASSVIRNGQVHTIPTEEIVPGDLVIAEEGGFINADGKVVYSHDFSVNESALTGEAFAVFKTANSEADHYVYSGTMTSSGMAIYEVIATGLQTKLGLLGSSITTIQDKPSPLQVQIESFVKKMAYVGILIFLVVWLISFLNNKDLIESLLNGLTLAMSILPEEIPVAFTTFMALGARRLIHEGVLIKKTRTVETIGSASVICTDKTGTITENRMMLSAVYDFRADKLVTQFENLNGTTQQLLESAMFASEPVPFDQMEKTIHAIYGSSVVPDRRMEFKMVHEYPLGGIPPMMTHVFENEDHQRKIAAKGAPEAILNVCELSPEELNLIQQQILELAQQGYRLLGIARSEKAYEQLPALQQEIQFEFLGLLAFYDPPKANIADVFNHFYRAGIKMKIITGDNPVTTQAISRSAGLREMDKLMDGSEVMKLSEAELSSKLHEVNVYTRMFPEAKLKVINILKKNNEVVAMVGDGVNDGPALKAADIGVAMGKKGTEIAKNAADMILLQDDLNKLVTAVATGRRIYSNLKKAVQYIISIHIPIISAVALPLFLGWTYPNIFTPVHVIFLELIMGPTCSIVYENEPIERDAMLRPPRPQTYSFLSWQEMSISIVQGLVISAGILFVYQYAVRQGGSEDHTRTMVFVTLILANIFLTLVNRSFYESFLSGLRHKNILMRTIIMLTLLLLAAMLAIRGVRDFFQMEILTGKSLLLCLATAIITVFWFEIYKWMKRQKPVQALG